MKKFVALACMLIFTCTAAIVLLAWPAQASPQNDLAAELFALTNAHRVSAGLPALLHGGATVQAAAHSRAAELRHLTDQQFRNHERPNGDDFIWLLFEYGIPFTDIPNENILRGHATPQAAMNQFSSSAAHNNTMLRASYTHLAIGVYEHNGRLYWAQIFVQFTPTNFPPSTAPSGTTTTTTTTSTTSTTTTTAAAPVTTTTTTAPTTTTTTTTTTGATTTTTAPTTTTTTTTTTAAGATTTTTAAPTTTTTTRPVTTTTAAGATTTTTRPTTTTATTAATTTTAGGGAGGATTTTTATTTTVATTPPPSTPSSPLASITEFFLSLLSVVFASILNFSLLR
ncbi:MAG: CAP domain-containing protein [Oscillospiraceae bacterium]|nr:CAP domain-containing protein [Oscillospiraceae bacterium]